MGKDLFDLTGKVAVITGGSRGLGRAMADEFAARGADVVIASRKAEACEKAAAEIAAATGRRVIGTGYHAGRWDDADRLAELALGELGKVDILVNNAGMSPLYPSLTAVTQELYDKVLAVNAQGPFRLSSLLGEKMAAGDGGSIINVSSIASVEPTPTELPYAMAKAALNTLTMGLSRAYAPKVRANVLMPGPFLTDIALAWDLEAFNENAKRNIPLQRGGEAHEVVGAALYLASDASSYTTGAIIKIDGGAARAPA